MFTYVYLPFSCLELCVFHFPPCECHPKSFLPVKMLLWSHNQRHQLTAIQFWAGLQSPIFTCNVCLSVWWDVFAQFDASLMQFVCRSWIDGVVSLITLPLIYPPTHTLTLVFS